MTVLYSSGTRSTCGKERVGNPVSDVEMRDLLVNVVNKRNMDQTRDAPNANTVSVMDLIKDISIDDRELTLNDVLAIEGQSTYNSPPTPVSESTCNLVRDVVCGYLEPRNLRALSGQDRDKWLEAMLKKFSSFMKRVLGN